MRGGGADVVRVVTEAACQDVCLLSDLPILAGLYDNDGKLGVYYEVKVLRMDGVVAVGTACRPYPIWRLPGGNASARPCILTTSSSSTTTTAGNTRRSSRTSSRGTPSGWATRLRWGPCSSRITACASRTRSQACTSRVQRTTRTPQSA